MSTEGAPGKSMFTILVSQKFRFWTFASMFFLVFVHGYNLNERYLQPWTLPGEALTPTSFTEYLLANGIFRFRIPMLFMISGYLFAALDSKPHQERVRKRISTLLTPYLFWSAFALAFTWVLELMPYSRDLIVSSHIVQINNDRTLVHDYYWYEVVGRSDA
jgi:surface polysaccharide O-acyltransferase-like enzyme